MLKNLLSGLCALVVLIGGLYGFFIFRSSLAQDTVIERDPGGGDARVTNQTAREEYDRSIAPTEELPIVHDVVHKDFAPDFTLRTLDGKEITLSAYRGEKPVVLDFFATWCHNCRRDMPKQQQLYEQYKNDVEVIAINVQEKQSTVERYIRNGGFTFPVVRDADGEVSNAYGIRFTNTHVLINRDGTIRDTIIEDIRPQHFTSLLQ